MQPDGAGAGDAEQDAMPVEDSQEQRAGGEGHAERPTARGRPIVYGPDGPDPGPDPGGEGQAVADESPEGDEGIRPKVRKGPAQPTAEEKRLHKCTHTFHIAHGAVRARMSSVLACGSERERSSRPEIGACTALASFPVQGTG